MTAVRMHCGGLGGGWKVLRRRGTKRCSARRFHTRYANVPVQAAPIAWSSAIAPGHQNKKSHRIDSLLRRLFPVDPVAAIPPDRPQRSLNWALARALSRRTSAALPERRRRCARTHLQRRAVPTKRGDAPRRSKMKQRSCPPRQRFCAPREAPSTPNYLAFDTSWACCGSA